MIIEATIPEIEEEANRLLARMTDGRLHVRLMSQRETLKGKTVETLDIEVADELGPRSYDLFSGGEAFRINFAIRVALSKLLARRAGARLQTLIVDEGFGTQDAQGRERLVEAIGSIQEDFERILVVTHIEELKDSFPVRIDVFKTPQGSQIAIA
jgi:exonuclease SbcC